jgi:RNA polymerase sigma-70 factor (ECF subfamily)
MPTKTAAGQRILSAMIAREPKRLTRRILRIIRDKVTAEDLAQESLVRALHGLITLRGEAEEPLLCSWLDRIARNVAYNYVRDQGRQPAAVSLNDHDTESEPLVDQLPTSDPDPALACSQKEVRHQLHTIIQSLPADLRAVFLLRDMEELSTADTATALDIGEGLVKWRLHRARALLRQRLVVSDGAG